MRSLSGLMTSRERSNSSYLVPIGEQRAQQLAMTEEIRNDEVRAYPGQAFAFPLVDVQALWLRRRHTYSNTAYFLDVFDFDVAVAETQELVALVFGFGD